MKPNVRCMKKKSHARYYQNLLHRCMGFNPKLTVLSKSRNSGGGFPLRVDLNPLKKKANSS